jgi:hypothetical protein
MLNWLFVTTLGLAKPPKGAAVPISWKGSNPDHNAAASYKQSGRTAAIHFDCRFSALALAFVE